MNQTPDATEQANIIIVDDTPANLKVLVGMLKDSGHKARAFLSGKLALQAAENSPPDLILLDIMMPEMDGFEVCRQLKANAKLRDIPVIFVSALSEPIDKVKAFGAGAIDYVTKPFQSEEVRARVETHLKLRRLQVALEAQNRHLEDLVREQVREISDSQMITIFALAKLAESRDADTGKHLERVQIYCRLLATKLREDPRYSESISRTYVDNLFHASPLHDIGKVAIPDSILLKPGRLSTEEFEIMKTHPTLGALTLEAVRARYPRNAFINMGIAIARSHHEKWDGSGYPNGLAGEDIPLAARIVAVADYYDAMRCKRCYKAAATHEDTCEIIFAASGIHFSPRIIEAFRGLEREFREVREKMAD
jgi:putative two-component system response regulator